MAIYTKVVKSTGQTKHFADWRDESGKRKRKSFTSRKKAAQFLRDVTAIVQQMRGVAPVSAPPKTPRKKGKAL